MAFKRVIYKLLIDSKKRNERQNSLRTSIPWNQYNDRLSICSKAYNCLRIERESQNEILVSFWNLFLTSTMSLF